jgi:hypothetical protein
LQKKKQQKRLSSRRALSRVKQPSVKNVETDSPLKSEQLDELEKKLEGPIEAVEEVEEDDLLSDCSVSKYSSENQIVQNTSDLSSNLKSEANPDGVEPSNDKERALLNRCKDNIGVENFSMINNPKKLEKLILLKAIYD